MGDSLSNLNLSNTAQGQWRARLGLLYLTTTADRLRKGTEIIDNYLSLDVKMHLATLTAGVDAPWGTGLTLVLPWVYVWRNDNFLEFAGVVGGKSDQGQGDLEVRVRQDLTQLLGTRTGPRWGLTLGVVAPTGVYLPAKAEGQNFLAGGGSQANGDLGRDISIGRGAWWLLGESDLSWAPLPRLSAFGSVQTRIPLGETVDGFAWGNELRGNAGVRYAVMPDLPELGIASSLLSLGLGTDVQWRAQPTWRPGGTSTEAVPFPNGGGLGWYVTPSLSSTPLPWLNVSVSYRMPVYEDMVGEQLVQNASLFLSVNGSFGISSAVATPPPAPPPSTAVIGQPPQVPEIAALVQTGKVTIVDYWATWCGPCMKLGPRLEEFAKARGDVVIARVDATEWAKPQWDKYLPGVAGLPVLDVFGVDGKLVKRLVGAEAEAFEAQVPVNLPLGASLSAP